MTKVRKYLKTSLEKPSTFSKTQNSLDNIKVDTSNNSEDSFSTSVSSLNKNKKQINDLISHIELDQLANALNSAHSKLTKLVNVLAINPYSLHRLVQEPNKTQNESSQLATSEASSQVPSYLLEQPKLENDKNLPDTAKLKNPTTTTKTTTFFNSSSSGSTPALSEPTKSIQVGSKEEVRLKPSMGTSEHKQDVRTKCNYGTFVPTLNICLYYVLMKVNFKTAEKFCSLVTKGGSLWKLKHLQFKFEDILTSNIVPHSCK